MDGSTEKSLFIRREAVGINRPATYNHGAMHCVKSVRIRSFSVPFLSLFSPKAKKYDPEKLRIRTLFTQG